MNDLDQLESESISILREAYTAFSRLGMLWSLGKDSNVMVWLAKKAFFGHIPFPLIHVDTGNKFPEMYEFRDRYAVEWGAELIIGGCPPLEDMDPDLPPATRRAARKTKGLKELLEREKFDGICAGIRRDEEGTRAKERVFSPRNLDAGWDVRDQPPELWGLYNTDFPPGTHVRVHPILHWSEIDIWRYVERENIPVVDLYFAKDGKRYRSLGDQDITHPVASEAATVAEIITELEQTSIAERSGRAMDNEEEDSFERLRAEGYM
ncbi:MAG: sulfate adenylyltransferase [Rhodospirillaceae bacterium]|nr:sulfate adenylyltransferase [Rhodospirillaceae bacterium]